MSSSYLTLGLAIKNSASQNLPPGRGYSSLVYTKTVDSVDGAR